MPRGFGWYRKSCRVPKGAERARVSIEFDGVHKNASVWINGHLLGMRPSGYMGFSHDLTPHLNLSGKNELIVRVDNSLQPNERWYTGSGIYRHVRLVIRNPYSVRHWGSQVTTPLVTADRAEVVLSHDVAVPAGDWHIPLEYLAPSGRIVSTHG